MEPKNNSFEQSENVQATPGERAESITSETSSHKMRIDELTGEEDHSMEVDNTSAKHNSSSSGSISKNITFNLIKLNQYFCRC